GQCWWDDSFVEPEGVTILFPCRGLRSRESPPRPLAGLLCLDFPIPRRRTGGQRLDQPFGGGGDLVNRAMEDGFVRLRRPVHAAQLPHELDGRRPDLILGRRRSEIGEGFDVPAHMVFFLSFGCREHFTVVPRRASTRGRLAHLPPCGLPFGLLEGDFAARRFPGKVNW